MAERESRYTETRRTTGFEEARLKPIKASDVAKVREAYGIEKGKSFKKLNDTQIYDYAVKKVVEWHKKQKAEAAAAKQREAEAQARAAEQEAAWRAEEDAWRADMARQQAEYQQQQNEYAAWVAEQQAAYDASQRLATSVAASNSAYEQAALSAQQAATTAPQGQYSGSFRTAPRSSSIRIY